MECRKAETWIYRIMQQIKRQGSLWSLCLVYPHPFIIEGTRNNPAGLCIPYADLQKKFSSRTNIPYPKGYYWMVTERGEDQRGNIPCKVSNKSAETGLFLCFHNLFTWQTRIMWLWWDVWKGDEKEEYILDSDRENDPPAARSFQGNGWKVAFEPEGWTVWFVKDESGVGLHA